MIGRNGERGSGISVPAARHDDDDIYIYIYIYICMYVCMYVCLRLSFNKNQLNFSIKRVTIQSRE